MSGFSYAYDVDGNATTAGTTSRKLAYNDLNLPYTVKNSSNTTIMTYTYDATGQKLRSVSTADGTREYISGINYEGTAIKTIATPEGRITNNSGVYSYQYDLKDHLGNVRMTFDKNPSGGAARVIQEDEYYAFGLRKPLYDNSNGNRYLYNGKELQIDLADQFDYGARFYDPVIGRWAVPDPMASTLYEISPYTYVRNNPVLRMDRQGLWDITVHVYKDREKYGYGIAVVTDRHGKEIYSFKIRLEGVGGRDRSKTNSDTPLGVYDIPDENMWISGGSRLSYGPNSRLALMKNRVKS